MMSERLLANLARRDWLINGPLSTIVSFYADSLYGQRYTERTVGVYMRCLAHFAYWARTMGVDLPHIDAALVERFLQHHLPVCSCPAPCKRSIQDMRAALRHLLGILPQQSLVCAVQDPINAELEQFRTYLSETCGVATSTCAFRIKHVGEFLRQHRDSSPVAAGLPTADDIDRFLTQLAKTWKPASLNVVCTYLRSYFRFRSLMGDSIGSQMAAIPRVAQWKQATLPKALSEAQLDAFLEAFDRSDATGQRDYAIARCLVDLGLRGQEVTNLTLDAIDWRRSMLTIGSNKSKRVQQLPMPTSTGEAMVDYLCHGRPQTANRALFVRHVAPFDKPLSVAAIRNTMNRAFARCGLNDLFCSTHVLRHTTATRLQKSGASLKEIADLMRHRSLDTTILYSKVDVDGLRAVALPWPGSTT
jgi:integrase/recombinase XerD